MAVWPWQCLLLSRHSQSRMHGLRCLRAISTVFLLIAAAAVLNSVLMSSFVLGKGGQSIETLGILSMLITLSSNITENPSTMKSESLNPSFKNVANRADILLKDDMNLSSDPTTTGEEADEDIRHKQAPENMSISVTFKHHQQIEDYHRSKLLWESSSILPPWMKQYFTWHGEQRRLLNQTNWQSKKYLILRCLEMDEKCGGASDRLQPVPFAIMVANQTNRIFFVRWERPAPVEEFLVPPQGGLDWRIPQFMDANLTFRLGPVITINRIARLLVGSPRMIIDMRHQGPDHGRSYYNSFIAKNEPTFKQVYRECWSLLFQPSPPVAALIGREMIRLGLQDDKYVAVHIRSLYRQNQANDNIMIQNAINCGSNLGSPIYVATDSNNATQTALQYGRQKAGRVFARMSERHPLHIDRGTNFLSRENPDWMEHPAEAFYDIFVDLYLIASARCVTHGIGGYGQWANLLSKNVSCVSNHQNAKCQWANHTDTLVLA